MTTARVTIFHSAVAIACALLPSCGSESEVGHTVVIQRADVQSIAEDAFPLVLNGTSEVPVPVTMRDPFVLFLDGGAPVGLKTEVAVTLPDVLPSEPVPDLVSGGTAPSVGDGTKTVAGEVLFSGHVAYREGDQTFWIVGLEPTDFALDGMPAELAEPLGQAVADALLKRLQSRQVGTFVGPAPAAADERVSVRDVSVIEGNLHVSIGA